MPNCFDFVSVNLLNNIVTLHHCIEPHGIGSLGHYDPGDRPAGRGGGISRNRGTISTTHSRIPSPDPTRASRDGANEAKTARSSEWFVLKIYYDIDIVREKIWMKISDDIQV